MPGHLSRTIGSSSPSLWCCQSDVHNEFPATITMFVTRTRHRTGEVSIRVNVQESPPVVEVPLNSTGSPTHAYDMLRFGDVAA